MSRLHIVAGMATLLLVAQLSGQGSIPEIPFESVPGFLKLPAHLHLGEAAGVAFVKTSTGFGYAAVWQKLCITRSALKPRQARSFSSSRVIGPVVSWLPTVVMRGSQ